MFLLTGLPAEFTKLIQLLLWIILPLLLFSILVTVLLHYGRKWRNSRNGSDVQEDFTHTLPENFCYSTGDGQFIYLDHTGLLKELRNKISYNQAKFMALKQDYEKLKSGHTHLIQNNTKINTMEHTENQEPIITGNTIAPGANSNERNEIASSPEEVNREYRNAEDENRSLKEQLVFLAASGGEKELIALGWKEENNLLKDKIAEQDYLKEIVLEKKAQIEFLQQQLEQRIKSGHESLQQKEEIYKDKENLARQLAVLEAELNSSREELNANKLLLTEKDTQWREQQEASSAASGQVIWLENSLKELQQQNELLNAAVADSNDQLVALKELLAKENNRAAIAEQSLLSNKELLGRLYKEFGAIFTEEETAVSPVIALKPDYARNGWGEQGVAEIYD